MGAPIGLAQPVYQSSVLETLDRAGAHFVLAKPNKAAVATRWQAEKPTLPAVLDWPRRPGNLIGIKPTSLGLVVVDLDEPENVAAEDLVALLGEPLVSVPTSKPAHVHL